MSSDDELSSNTSSSCDVESLQLAVGGEGSLNSIVQPYRFGSWKETFRRKTRTTKMVYKTHVLVAPDSISLFCLEERIYIITLLNPLAVLIVLLIKPITSSRCVEDTPGYTLVHTLVHGCSGSAECGVPSLKKKLKIKIKK